MWPLIFPRKTSDLDVGKYNKIDANIFQEWWWCGGYCQRGKASKRQPFATNIGKRYRGLELALGSKATLSLTVKPQGMWCLIRKASFNMGKWEMKCSVEKTEKRGHSVYDSMDVPENAAEIWGEESVGVGAQSMMGISEGKMWDMTVLLLLSFPSNVPSCL